METVDLLAEMTGVRVVCVNPCGADRDGHSNPLTLEEMVSRIEDVRRHLALGRWIFWGMSGGGWIAQIYARRHPESLRGIVVESSCSSFRERLADPDCVLSPFFPAWREPLRSASLLPQLKDIQGPFDDIEWVQVETVGHILRHRGGPAVLVSPMPLSSEMKSMMPHFLEFDSRPWLASLGVPALVLCGTADPVVPPRHPRAVHDAIEGSSFVEISGAGHVPVSERRPEVAAAFGAFLKTRVSY